MVLVVQTGSGDIIDRMWRLVVSARRNDDSPEIWRLTDDILDAIREFYRLGRHEEGRSGVGGGATGADRLSRFLDIPVDPTTTAPHLLCRPDVVYHL